MKDIEEIKINSGDFFRIVKGEQLHELKFIKRNDFEQLTPTLSFFHRLYYFDWKGTKVHSCISSACYPDGEFRTSFTHADGEPSEIGPRFVISASDEVERPDETKIGGEHE